MWFALTGLLTLSASYNYIINSACVHSVQQMEEKHKEYEEDIAESNTKNNIPQTVYTTHE